MNLGMIRSLLLTTLLLTCGAVAQEAHPPSILYGPVVGLEAGIRGSRLPVYAGSFDCGAFTSGAGLRPSLGGTFALPSLFGTGFGLSGSVSVGKAIGEFTTTPAEPIRVLDEGRDELVELDRNFRLKYQELGLGMDILARYSFAGGWSIAAGPSIGYRLAATYQQSDNVDGPGNYRFEDGRSEHPMELGAPVGAGHISFGPMLMATYEMPFAGGLLLQPGLTIRANLVSPVENAPWREFEIGGRLAILFQTFPSPAVPGHFMAPPPVPAPPVPVPPVAVPPVVVVEVPKVEEPSISKRPRLHVDLSLAGIDVDDRPVPFGRITVNELLYRRVAPLLPAVFFEHEAADLPARYGLLSSADAEAFSVDSLSTVDILDVQHHALDVIGARLRGDRSATVTLFGSASKDEPASLAGPRAARVRSYLEDVWGIDRSRIALRKGGFMERSNESTEDGRSDNRRVEIAASVESITGPVRTERVARDFNPPLVAMTPMIESEAGVRRWSLTLSQNGNVVARYTGDDGRAPDPAQLHWRLDDDRIDAGLAPLVAELTVEDSAGAMVVASTEVPLVVERRVKVVDGRIERNGNRERVAYVLVGFDFNSAELDRYNRVAVDDITSMIRDGAEVTITGYTDRIGDGRRNEDLSAERAARVAEALRSALEAHGVQGAVVKAIGGGMETERFTNDLPEGRVLSRGVQIVVEQDAAEEKMRP